MSLTDILLLILILILLGVFPRWSHSKNWGYGPSGVIGTIILILVLFMLLGYV